jgi:rhodanese-related sulfurtransferase
VLAAGAVLTGGGGEHAPWAGEVKAPPEGRVGAVELARALREGRERLRVLDVREEAAYEEGHVPRAERVDPRELPEVEVAAGGTLVVYSADGGRATRARAVLRALGHPDVRVLEGGYGAWLLEVMYPVLPPDPSAEERRVFDRAADLSRYYGGAPGRGDREDLTDPREGLRERIADARAAGCGW